MKLMENNFIPISDDFEDIIFIEGEQNAKYPYSNSMIVGTFLIDTGVGSKNVRKIIRKYDIDKVLLTHWHEDHINGNRHFKGKNIQFLSHEQDKPLIEDIERMYNAYGVKDTPLESDFKQLIQVLRMKNIEVSKTFQDKQILHLSDLPHKIQVFHTPGHTAGHCSFYEMNSKIAFLGDIDLTNFSFYGSLDADLITFENSIEKLKDLDMEFACTGHKGVIIGNKEIKAQLENYEKIIKKRDKRILNHLSESNPINPTDLKGKNLIYKKYSQFENYELLAEKIMIGKHFEKFLQNKVIEKINNGYVLK
ncbi:MAG: Hydroxyacylglutathione hydrolase [Promethearchaeota archaeon]|nr:MAG: Hydroxyacylglutathione hydrolase [Candidatus Lokiarchaeota archaeon]